MKQEKLKEILEKHRFWLDGEEGRERANFSWDGFSGADLWEEVSLAGVDLRKANCVHGRFEGADLRGADLRDANFAGADLGGADLEGADLRDAYFEGVNFTGANLKEVKLTHTQLFAANFMGALLKGTCLDPDAEVPVPSVEEIETAGLELKGDQVWGWRTDCSAHYGSTRYLPGQVYEAPVFSVDTETDCHPGIYLAGKDWLKRAYPYFSLVRCYALRNELVRAGDKWRAKRIWVVEAEGTDGETN